MKPLAAFAGVALLLLALVGCGQKGPLYLPEDDKPPAEEPDTDQ